MGNYIIFFRCSNILGEQASKTFYNKCSENSRSQIVLRTDIFQKLSLGAPEQCLGLSKITTLVDNKVFDQRRRRKKRQKLEKARQKFPV